MVDTSRIRLWWLAIRPRTLPAAVAPIIVGSALALDGGVFASPIHDRGTDGSAPATDRCKSRE